jgi:hypothetical protein
VVVIVVAIPQAVVVSLVVAVAEDLAAVFAKGKDAR